MPVPFRISCAAFAALSAFAIAADPEPAPSSGLSLLRQLDQGFIEVFEKVAPSVVVIEATKRVDAENRDLRDLHFFQNDKEPRSEPDERAWALPSRSEGSGFIIRSDGYILTNHHVIAEADKIVVRLKDGRSFAAEKIGTDDKTDIAIIRIDAKDLPAATIGDSDAVRVGQLVCAIGAPFNQHFSFSVGWVSGKSRTNLLGPTNTSSILYEDYIQTDTFINPGNSGGPLFDVEGHVIGMNTLINGIGRGLAFAIPSSMFQEVSQQLITHRKMQRPWLGVRMDTLSDRHSLRDHIVGVDRGVIVETIEPGSPAYKSELRAADVIVEIDKVKVGTALELQKEILKKKIGATVQLSVWRAGAMLKIPVATGELPQDLTLVTNTRPGKLSVEPRAESLGLQLRDARPAGAIVAGVAAGSPAERAALQKDDRITDVAGRPIRDAAGAAAAIGDILRENRRRTVVLDVERGGKRMIVDIRPE